MRRVQFLLYLGFGLLMVGTGSALAAPPYPSPPPDFAHSGSPHSSVYSFDGGRTDRPMLVIYAQFDDTPFPAGLDAAFMNDRFFGPFPSVANYFVDDSFGQLALSAAAETDASNGGAANDGVVSISVAGNKSDFISMTAQAQNKALLEAVNASVDFAAFDTNGNGTITDLELVVNRIDADPDASGGCGATRGHDAVSLDGKAMSLSVAMDGTDTNLMTIIHETAHVALHTRDLYGFGVGSFDISGPTCGPGDNLLFRTSSWQRMHLGWSSPVVVTRDGFADVNGVDLAGESFILYDPDEGTDDYYMVENRIRAAGTYDQAASDDGLVIWKISDSDYNSGDEAVRPIDIQAPDGMQRPGSIGCCFYGGSPTDAWDPTDTNTPQRTFAPGTGPRVAVRAIGARRTDGIIRAFFDVRGPGILVDPSTPQGQPMTIDVTPEESNAVSVPVMNTGEATDTFDFSLVGLPGGWTSGTDNRSLGDHAGANASISLMPAANAPTGPTEIFVAGQSTTDPPVASSSPFTVNVVLDDTDIAYTGLTSVPTGEPAGFSALVTNPDDPGTPPVPGATVTFALSGPGGTQSATALTNGSGVAAISPALSVPPGTYTLNVSMPRLGKHAPASTTVAYTVERRPTTLIWVGDLSAQYSDPATASARLVDTLSGTPLSGKPIGLTIGTQSAAALTDGLGVASDTIVLNQPSGMVTAAATFAGDATYLPSSASSPFTVLKERLTFAYTGDTVVAAPGVPILAAQATEEADGSPGDLSLAQARFDLAPTLTATPFSYTAPVDGAGLSSTPATGLPVDLWNVAVMVPASNAFWEGATPGSTELALFDTARSLNGTGHGLDGSSMKTKLTLSGIHYDLGMWRNRSTLDVSMGRFTGDAYAWVIVVGDQAIAEVGGSLDAAVPATMRYRLTDNGSPGSGADVFMATVRDGTDTVLYDSGPVTLMGGNLDAG